MRRAATSFAAAVGLALFLAVLGVPRSGLAENAGTGPGDGIAARNGKAGTMAELARMYDSGPCASCHREIYDQWRTSAHGTSIFGGGKTAAALQAAVLDGLMRWPASGVKSEKDVTVTHLMGCAKCHLPQMADAEDAVARETVAAIAAWRSALDNKDAAATARAAEKLEALNIGCLICHNRNAITHKWTDGYPKAGELYGGREGAHPGPAYSVLRKSPIMGESIFCGQCHALGPNLELDNPTQCSSVYGSYLYTYKAEGGPETCQDCHMRKGRLGHATAAPGGGKDAVDVAVDARGFQWRDGSHYVPRVAVDVAMTNKAGHSLPGSISTQKRLVLEVTARDDDGATVFSGSKTYAPLAQRFGRGVRTGYGPYEKTGIIEDTALPANRTIREKFDILLEPREPGPQDGNRSARNVTVDVTLKLVDSGTAPAVSTTWRTATEVVKLENVR
ncbi:MAG: multiheme c-type cytochrome (seleno)protein ExtKL [Gemmatimonadota bacterium]